MNRKKRVFSRRRFPVKKRIFKKRLARSFPRKPEVKSVDINVTDLLLTSLAKAAVIPLNLIAQGTNFYNRIGNRVQGQSVEAWGRITNLSTTSVVPLRVMCVYDKDPNGVLPVISNILQDVDSGGTSQTTAMSGRNVTTTLRFRTIFDRYIALQANNSGNDTSMYHFNFWNAIRQFRTQYIGVSANIGSIGAGAFYLVIQADVIDAVNGTNVNYSTRFRYSDA